MRKIEVHIEEIGVDQAWLENSLDDLRLKCSISCVLDGAEAVDVLLKLGKYLNADERDLIFLDVHLPKQWNRSPAADTRRAKFTPLV
jgi:hypothetical protein